jgi:hypothetical protein
VNLQIAAAILCAGIILLGIFKGLRVGFIGFFGLLAIACIPDVHQVFQRIDPNPATVTYSDAHQGTMGWVMDQYTAEGYAMPRDGDRFNWSDYMAIVDPDTDTPQPWDLVLFVDDTGQHLSGIVESVDGKHVTARVPFRDDYISEVVDDALVYGYLRPHKKVDPKGSR